MNKATCWIEIKLRKTLWNYQVESKVRKGGGNTWIALWCVATFSGLDFLISLIFLTPLQVNVVLLGLYLQKQLCCVTWDDVQSFNWCSTGRWSSSEICAWSKHTNPGLSTPHFHMITSPERSSNFAGWLHHPLLQRGKTSHWELLQPISSPMDNSASLQLQNLSIFLKWHTSHRFSLPILTRGAGAGGALCVLLEYHLSFGSQLLYEFYKFEAAKSKKVT